MSDPTPPPPRTILTLRRRRPGEPAMTPEQAKRLALAIKRGAANQSPEPSHIAVTRRKPGEPGMGAGFCKRMVDNLRKRLGIKPPAEQGDRT